MLRTKKQRKEMEIELSESMRASAQLWGLRVWVMWMLVWVWVWTEDMGISWRKRKGRME